MASAEQVKSRAFLTLVALIGAAATVWLLRTLHIVLVPLLSAFFIAILLKPVQLALHERLPGRARVLALPLTMLFLLAIVVGAGWALAEVTDEVVETAPKYEERLKGIYAQATSWAASRGLPVPSDPLSSTGMRERLGSLAESTVRTVWALVTGLVLVFFLVLLMLLEQTTWREKLRALLSAHNAPKAVSALEVVALKVRRYLWIRTLVSALSAAAASVWLLIMGVDLVVLWAALIFALNYIPNIGSVIAVFPPSLLALLQFGLVRGLVTIAGLTIIEQIIGNYLDPWLQGRRLQLSALVVLVALVFWTWLWGTAGALLAVPVTVAIMVIAAHIPGLEPMARLLSGTADAAEFERDINGD